MEVQSAERKQTDGQQQQVANQQTQGSSTLFPTPYVLRARRSRSFLDKYSYTQFWSERSGSFILRNGTYLAARCIIRRYLCRSRSHSPIISSKPVRISYVATCCYYCLQTYVVYRAYTLLLRRVSDTQGTFWLSFDMILCFKW